MTVTLFTLDGTRMETDRVLEASADWQAGSPAAQFSAVLPGENWPEELVTVRWKDDSGFTLFEGYLDTAAQVLDSDGPRLEVTARSAGCYLLDNEALPQSYDSVTLDSFCQRYLDSYGISLGAGSCPGTHSLHRPQGPERTGSPGGVCLCPHREVSLSQPGGGALSAAPGRNCRTALQHPHRGSAVSHPDAFRAPERAHLQGAGPG